MKRIICIYGIMICCFAAISVSAQTRDADSLYVDYEHASDKKERLRLAREINIILREHQYTSVGDSVFTDEQTKVKLDELTINNMTLYAYHQSHYSDVLKYGEKAIALSRMVGDSIGVADNMGLISGAYQMTGQIGKALDYLQQAIDLQKLSDDEYGLSVSYHNLGQIYLYKGYNEVALMYLQKALEIAQKIDQTGFEATCLSSIGDVYNYEKRYDEAMDYVIRAFELHRKEGDSYGMMIARIQMAEINIDINRLTEAESFLDSALILCDSVSDRDTEALIMMTYGRLRMVQKRLNEADEFFQKGLDISREIGNVETEREIYEKMYKLYKPTDMKKSYIALEKYFEINNKYYNEDVQESITNFHYRVATEEKELQIALQKSELRRGNIVKLFLAAIAIVFLVLLLITNRYRQLVRRRNRELREMNATKDKFFSIISHDLKNPALAQQQALKTIVDNFSLLDEKILRSQCSMLLQSADSQVELLHNLLGWAQIQTGRMPFRPTHFDIAIVIREVSELMAVSLIAKNIRFESSISADSIVYGDRTMIATIIRNIVSNAIKFTPEGGTIHVDAVTRNKKSYSVTIRDNGIGMSEEMRRNLFRIDRRTSRLGTAGESGSGLGLIVCRELAERNGGTLTIESTEGVGTSFIFDVK